MCCGSSAFLEILGGLHSALPFRLGCGPESLVLCPSADIRDPVEWSTANAHEPRAMSFYAPALERPFGDVEQFGQLLLCQKAQKFGKLVAHGVLLAITMPVHTGITMRNITHNEGSVEIRARKLGTNSRAALGLGNFC
jgi:hypothetical protein